MQKSTNSEEHITRSNNYRAFAGRKSNRNETSDSCQHFSLGPRNMATNVVGDRQTHACILLLLPPVVIQIRL